MLCVLIIFRLLFLVNPRFSRDATEKTELQKIQVLVDIQSIIQLFSTKFEKESAILYSVSLKENLQFCILWIWKGTYNFIHCKFEKKSAVLYTVNFEKESTILYTVNFEKEPTISYTVNLKRNLQFYTL